MADLQLPQRQPPGGGLARVADPGHQALQMFQGGQGQDNLALGQENLTTVIKDGAQTPTATADEDPVGGGQWGQGLGGSTVDNV
jgi:hypothetical protein